MRHTKTVNSVKTTHVWDGSNIALELNNSNAVSARYIRGINLIKTAANVYFLYNAHGDVVQLTNSSGAKTKDYRYDAFGVETGKAENDTNPWRYCGEYWDDETGTIYLRARYYSPRTGRFLSEDMHWNTGNMIYGDNPVKWNERKANEKDPLGLNTYTYKLDITAIIQSGNLYAYCMSNPIFFVDPTGNASIAAEAGVSLWQLLLYIAALIAEGTMVINNTMNLTFPRVGVRGVTGLGPSSAFVEAKLPGIAGQYGVFECVDAAAAMVGFLTLNNQNGEIIEIQFSGAKDRNFVISLTYPGDAISTNGRHVGVLYNGMVYCNVHPYGLPEEVWLNDFEGLGVRTITRIPF